VADRHPDHRGLGVLYAVVFFGTVGTRKVAHLRGQLVLWCLHHCVALLHMVNSAAIPAG
jgi:cytochrome c oxidase cbb3-type subunit 1